MGEIKDRKVWQRNTNPPDVHLMTLSHLFDDFLPGHAIIKINLQLETQVHSPHVAISVKASLSSNTYRPNILYSHRQGRQQSAYDTRCLYVHMHIDGVVINSRLCVVKVEICSRWLNSEPQGYVDAESLLHLMDAAMSVVSGTNDAGSVDE